MAVACAATLLISCSGQLEQSVRSDLRLMEAKRQHTPLSPATAETPSPRPDGTLASYVAEALSNSPKLRASYEQWRASTLSVSRARRLPDPTIAYGYFLRSVETRVGPQRHRFSLSQSFPWPTKLSAGGDSAAAIARAAQRQFDAQLLAVAEQVASAYWQLWLIDEEHRLMTGHDEILSTLAGVIRSRVETGSASLADLNQIDLNVSRHNDHHGVHAQARVAAEGKLLATLGAAPTRQSLAISDAPSEPALGETDAALRSAAGEHPSIQTHEQLAVANDHRARAEAADRYPSFRLGFDYIETGEAQNPDLEDSGTDPVVVSVGLSIPLWQSSYGDAEDAAHARAAAHRASREDAVQQANAALSAALSKLRDADRRIQLYRHTLIPQAETTFHAVLGGYQTGRSTVAAGLLAQRDLLDLQIELARARAQRALAWAKLERIVGHPLTTTEAEQGDYSR